MPSIRQSRADHVSDVDVHHRVYHNSNHIHLTRLCLLKILFVGGLIIIVTQGWVVNGVRRHAEPLGDNDPPQLLWFKNRKFSYHHTWGSLSRIRQKYSFGQFQTLRRTTTPVHTATAYPLWVFGHSIRWHTGLVKPKNANTQGAPAIRRHLTTKPCYRFNTSRGLPMRNCIKSSNANRYRGSPVINLNDRCINFVSCCINPASTTFFAGSVVTISSATLFQIYGTSSSFTRDLRHVCILSFFVMRSLSPPFISLTI
jgi:hypothetical protein